MKRVIFMAILGIILTGCSSKIRVNNTVIKDFDVNRYLGNWYEIARFNHSFESGMEYTKARYTLRDDGKIEVVNTGIKNSKLKKAVGRAKLTRTPGLLKVSFFGPFYADYRILMLSDDYTYALVGSKGDNYLWILSRTPTLSEAKLAKLLSEAKRRGYDISKFIWVRQ